AGTIEDSRITVGGNVLCKFGFLGQGKGLIEAKGNVNIGFLKNQRVRSRKNVSIAKEALNAVIYAKNSIEVFGNPLSVAGGHLIARDSIIVYTAGNNSNIRTILEVGLDFTMVEGLKKIETQIEEISENKSKLLEPIKRFNRLIKARKKLPAKEEFLFNKLKNTLKRYEQQITELESRKNAIEKKMRDTENAFIKINHAAMPGTIFKIGTRYHLVKDELVGPKTVRLIKNQFRIL
ncbi:MAG: DUF342 domain-containing protein, partial [Chitinivibrionales bacterium]|nr:DUF342 domain-containing protein [Chitinivibrionales bacterium]